MQVFGALEGYEGLIDGRFRELTRLLADGTLGVDLEVDTAGGQGGTLIGSARSMRFREPEGRAQAAAAQLMKAGARGADRHRRQRPLTGAHVLCDEHG